MPYVDDEKRKEYNRNYYRQYCLKHPDKVKARHKKYKQENKDKIRSSSRIYYLKNKERIDEYRKRYDSINAQRIAIRKHAYYRLVKDHITTRSREYSKTSKEKWKETLLSLLGNRCGVCGYSDTLALQFDHITGGGSKEMRSMTRNGMIRMYVNNPELAKQKLQVLCANCNWIKRHEKQEVQQAKSIVPKTIKQRNDQQRKRNKLMDVLGTSCVSCGYSDRKALQIDHICGGGSKEFREKFNKGYLTFLNYYLKHPEEAKEKLQILCVNCNRTKVYKNKELPSMKIPILSVKP